jgi:hypothetical protein
VKHQTADLIGNFGDLGRVMFTQAAKGAGRIGQVELGRGNARIDPQPAHMPLGRAIEFQQLADGIENDLVGMGQHLINLVIRIGDRIGMGLARELLVAQANLIQRRRRRAVHILRHEVKDRPRRKTFQREQTFDPGGRAQLCDLFKIAKKMGFIDQVIGGLHSKTFHWVHVVRLRADPKEILEHHFNDVAIWYVVCRFFERGV